MHSTSSLGLPRLVPHGPGVTIAGHYFPRGTVLSVPTYTMHHCPEIWNPCPSTKGTGTPKPDLDPSVFNPLRFHNHHHLTPCQKQAFNPFSTGPRACVGRNLAMMELKMICATVCLNFDFELTPPQKRPGGWRTREGFLRKPLGLEVYMKTRVRNRRGKGVD